MDDDVEPDEPELEPELDDEDEPVLGGEVRGIAWPKATDGAARPAATTVTSSIL